MWVRVQDEIRGQDENTAIIWKGWQIFKTTNSRDMWTWIQTPIGKELSRNETEIPNKAIDC